MSEQAMGSGRTPQQAAQVGDTDADGVLPLEGVTVVALEHAVSAPFCTRQLADMGARVIKIERPGMGDFARHYDERVAGMASYFVWSNRSKESLTLDLKAPPAREILERLLAGADVLVQNLAPGATERLGLSYAALAPRFPRLIVCDISGYGDAVDAPGPYRDRKAYDLLIQSESGFVSISGTPEAPAKAGCSIADIASATCAYGNILTALIARGRTGRGRRIDVSMLESMIEYLGAQMYYAYQGAPAPARQGAAHATIYPYGPFPTGDGKTVMMGLQNEREWAVFCDHILEQADLKEDPRFCSNSARSANRAALLPLITEAFSRWTLEEVRARLDAAEIANAQLNDMGDVWAHPQLRARSRWVEVDSPVGRLPALLPAGADDLSQVRMDPVPDLGQHSAAILRELGYSDAQIAAWREQAVI